MLNANYILGLVDGEGSFTAYIRKLNDSRERKRRVRIEPKFYLKLIEEDKRILYELKKYFGCGNVYFQRDSRKNHKDCYRYEVTDRKMINEKIIPFFLANQLKLKSKLKDFRLFCRIMDGIKNNKHLTDKGLCKLKGIKDKMH